MKGKKIWSHDIANEDGFPLRFMITLFFHNTAHFFERLVFHCFINWWTAIPTFLPMVHLNRNFLDSVTHMTCHSALETIQHELYVSFETFLPYQLNNDLTLSKFSEMYWHTHTLFKFFFGCFTNDVWRIFVKQAKVAATVSQILFC